MTTPYNISSVTKGVNGFGLPFCDTIYTATLGAATEATVTVPGSGSVGSLGVDKFIAVFSYKLFSDVWVAVNATAAVSAGATLLVSTSELNPSAKYVKAGDVIHVITATAATDISIALYAIQE